MGQGLLAFSLRYHTIVTSLRSLTWIELGIVLALSLLFGTWFFSFVGSPTLGPTERDALRTRHLHVILEALVQYSLDHDGNIPYLSPKNLPICHPETIACTDGVDLRFLVPRYIDHIPADPLSIALPHTLYTIRRDGDGRITLEAPHAEEMKELRVSQ